MRVSACSTFLRSGTSSLMATLDAPCPRTGTRSCGTTENRSTQFTTVVAAHVAAQHPRGALVELVEAQEQAGDGGLSGPGRAHQGDSLALCARETTPRQHRGAGAGTRT